MLTDMTIAEFNHALAADSATPGGGTVAALNGALGSSLLIMLCRLTLGREKYASAHTQIHEILTVLLALQEDLLKLINEDATAFDSVMDAYQLPRQTEGEKQQRRAAIQAGLKRATETPMRILDKCVGILNVAPEALRIGNVNALSDGGAGILAAHAGMMMAAANVSINLNSINDREFVDTYRQRMRLALAEGDKAKELGWAITIAGLGM